LLYMFFYEASKVLIHETLILNFVIFSNYYRWSILYMCPCDHVHVCLCPCFTCFDM
jgi:hypothetical protein